MHPSFFSQEKKISNEEGKEQRGKDRPKKKRSLEITEAFDRSGTKWKWKE
jgi:hypothetical protein